MSRDKHCYDILGLAFERQPDFKKIKAAYHTLVRKFHPDKNSSPHAKVRFVQIQEAWETLSTRKKYLAQPSMWKCRCEDCYIAEDNSNYEENIDFEDYFDFEAYYNSEIGPEPERKHDWKDEPDVQLSDIDEDYWGDFDFCDKTDIANDEFAHDEGNYKDDEKNGKEFSSRPSVVTVTPVDSDYED